MKDKKGRKKNYLIISFTEELEALLPFMHKDTVEVSGGSRTHFNRSETPAKELPGGGNVGH